MAHETELAWRSSAEAVMADAELSAMRIAIVIATTGRPDVVGDVAKHWVNQTRKANVVMVVCVTAEDAGDLANRYPDIDVRTAPRGLPAQRNVALEALRDKADVVVFFDDDFVPSRYFIERLAVLFWQHPNLAIATGRVLQDGILGPGLSYSEAARIVDDDDNANLPPSYELEPRRNAYGCNMITHLRLAPDVRFDERLPLYAWLEDVDYSVQMSRYGEVAWCRALTGVHMGAKVGRTPGRRMGYSQIANTAYLVSKGTLSVKDAIVQSLRNFGMNLARVLWPEPWMDRRGRLIGNLIGLRDLALGRADPNRMLDL